MVNYAIEVLKKELERLRSNYKMLYHVRTDNSILLKKITDLRYVLENNIILEE